MGGIVQKVKLDHERMRKRQFSKLQSYQKELQDMKKTEQKNEKLKSEVQDLRDEVNTLKLDNKHAR